MDCPNEKQQRNQRMEGNRKRSRLKFDLLNVIDDRLVFLEIKNRVDSGGTAAREEALAKNISRYVR